MDLNVFLLNLSKLVHEALELIIDTIRNLLLFDLNVLVKCTGRCALLSVHLCLVSINVHLEFLDLIFKLIDLLVHVLDLLLQVLLLAGLQHFL